MKSNVPFIAKLFIGVTSVVIADQQWSWFHVDNYTNMILVGVLMQVCLSFFIWLEGFSANLWQRKGNTKLHKVGRAITSYISLVGGKFVTMGIISLAFGESVMIGGYFGGLVTFFALIFVILGLEKAVEHTFYSSHQPQTQSVSH